MKPLFFCLLTLFAFSVSSVSAELVTEVVEYRDGSALLEGYMAYDNSFEGKRPGVLVVHEWTGHGEYARKRAEMLAGLGYIGFAIDMYGKGIFAKNHEEAAQLSGIYSKDRRLMRSRAKAALDFFLQNPLLDTKKIAAIGYCFGGTTVLEMARAGFDLKGVASFHGGLGTPLPAQPGDIKASVLVLHGANDDFTNKDVSAFQQEMRNSGADWQMNIYSGAVHGFTVWTKDRDPSDGIAYNPTADRRSWAALKLFLTEIFGG